MAKDKYGKELRAKIIADFKAGMKQAAICDRYSIGKSTISRIIGRFKATGSSNVQHRGGRSRETSARQDRLICRKVKSKPFVTATKIKDALNLDCSPRTIQRRIREAGFVSCKPIKKPLINERNRLKRLAFAKEHLDWTPRQWRAVLFTDESKFNMFGSDGNFRVWRPQGKRFDYRYTQKTVKYGGGSIMVWGCFSYAAVGPLHRIDGIMDSLMYRDIMENVMLPYASEEMPLKWTYQQDNDPKHTARIVKRWFEDNNVSVMGWPAQSPDLNPIENLWSIVDQRIDRSQASNKDALFQAIQEAWNAIPEEIIHNLVDSMPRRCQAAIAAKGYATKY